MRVEQLEAIRKRVQDADGHAAQAVADRRALLAMVDELLPHEHVDGRPDHPFVIRPYVPPNTGSMSTSSQFWCAECAGWHFLTIEGAAI